MFHSKIIPKSSQAEDQNLRPWIVLVPTNHCIAWPLNTADSYRVSLDRNKKLHSINGLDIVIRSKPKMVNGILISNGLRMYSSRLIRNKFTISFSPLINPDFSTASAIIWVLGERGNFNSGGDPSLLMEYQSPQDVILHHFVQHVGYHS